MRQANGSGQIETVKPTIRVEWDAEDQTVELKFRGQDDERPEFKTWDFVLAVLNMATQKAEQLKRAVQVANMQRQQAEAMQNQAIAQKLLHGR